MRRALASVRLSSIALAGTFLASSAAAEPVKLSATDGVSLAAERYGSGARGVVLVHAQGRSSADWARFGERLAKSGFHVVAVDLRGHGASVPPEGPEDYAIMVQDVNAAASWLKGHGATTVSVVGAQLGANLALQAAAANETINDVALLSPGLNIHGVKIGDAVGNYGQRPLLAVAAEQDALSAKAATLLVSKAAGPKHLRIAPGSTSGTRMLNTAPDLESLLVSWLNGSLRASTAAGAAHDLNPGSVGDIETSGTKIQDR